MVKISEDLALEPERSPLLFSQEISSSKSNFHLISFPMFFISVQESSAQMLHSVLVGVMFLRDHWTRKEKESKKERRIQIQKKERIVMQLQTPEHEQSACVKWYHFTISGSHHHDGGIKGDREEVLQKKKKKDYKKVKEK